MIMNKENQKKEDPTGIADSQQAESLLPEESGSAGLQPMESPEHAEAVGQSDIPEVVELEPDDASGITEEELSEESNARDEDMKAENAEEELSEEESATVSQPADSDEFQRFIAEFGATDFTDLSPLDFLRRAVESAAARDDATGFGNALHESLLHTEGFIEGSGLSVAAVEEALHTLMAIASDMTRGEIKGETLKLISRGHSHQLDVEMARSQGVIEGRNARIVEEFRVADDAGMKKQNGRDTIPRLGGTASSPARALSNSIFDLAREAQ